MSRTVRREARRNAGASAGGLVGRGAVLAFLAGARAAAVGGHGGVVLLTGEPGIGNTTVAAAATAAAAREGWRTIWASCWEGDAAAGYGPWVQVVRDLVDDSVDRPSLASRAPAIDAIMPGSATPAGADASPGASAADRFQLFDELSSLTLDATRDAPLQLVFDDLQWADPGSIWLLAGLARRLKAAPVLVLATVRDVGGSPVPAGLAENATQATTFPLAPLSAAEVEAVMTAAMGSQAAPLVTEVHRRSGGNPFFVMQLTAMLVRSGLSPSSVPGGARESIDRWLALLDPGTVQILSAAAVLDGRFTAGILSRIVGITVEEAGTRLEAATRANIVSGERDDIDGDTYRFAHDLFRQALVDRLSGTDRARLHRKVADGLRQEVLAGRGIGLARLAHHYAAGGPGVAAEALDYARQAAAEAGRRLAHGEAVGHWGRAVRLHERLKAGDVPDRVDLLLELGDACRRAGALEAGRDAYRHAAGLSRALPDAERLARSALGLQAIGSRSVAVLFDELEAALEEAARALGERDTRLRAAVLAGLARELTWKVGRRHDDRAEVLADAAVAVATRCGDPAALAECLLAKHNVMWAPGNAGSRLALTRRIRALGEDIRSAEVIAEAQLLAVSDMWESADTRVHLMLEEFGQTASSLHQPRWRYATLARLAAAATAAGRLAEAEVLIADAAAVAADLGEPDAADVEFTQLWELRGLQGRRSELHHRIAELFPGSSPVGLLYRAAALLDAGDPDAARAELAALRELDLAEVPRDRSWLTAMAMAGEVAATMRDRDQCARLRDLLTPHAGEMVVVGVAIAIPAPVEHHLGRLNLALGDEERARSHFRNAISTADRLGAHALALRSRHELALLDLAEPATWDRGRTALIDVERAAAAAGLAGTAKAARVRLDALDRVLETPAELREQGDGWSVSYAGMQVLVADVKGIHDLVVLIRSAGTAIRAVDLVAAEDSAGIAAAALRMGADQILDDRGRRQVRARLADLDAELDEAERFHDSERAARVAAERTALLDALGAAVGLGGRPRRLGDTAERARKAVTARLRDAISRIDSVHPDLGAHLRASVSTGTFCCYTPATPVTWVVD